MGGMEQLVSCPGPVWPGALSIARLWHHYLECSTATSSPQLRTHQLQLQEGTITTQLQTPLWQTPFGNRFSLKQRVQKDRGIAFLGVGQPRPKSIAHFGPHEAH